MVPRGHWHALIKTSDDFNSKVSTFSPQGRRVFETLRALIHQIAASTPDIGPLDEALRWGEPSFLTNQSQSGSLVRMDAKPKSPYQFHIYFHCQTGLIDHFKDVFGDQLQYEGNRAIVIDVHAPIPTDALTYCLRKALTYKLKKP